jgi:hypothetical protein
VALSGDSVLRVGEVFPKLDGDVGGQAHVSGCGCDVQGGVGAYTGPGAGEPVCAANAAAIATG